MSWLYPIFSPFLHHHAPYPTTSPWYQHNIVDSHHRICSYIHYNSIRYLHNCQFIPPFSHHLFVTSLFLLVDIPIYFILGSIPMSHLHFLDGYITIKPCWTNLPYHLNSQISHQQPFLSHRIPIVSPLNHEISWKTNVFAEWHALFNG